MEYCRTQRKPYMLEPMVSRLYGHSSSSGAIRVKNEPDCIALFEQKLIKAGVLDRETIRLTHAEAEAEVEVALEQTIGEPRPTVDDIHRHSYAPSSVDPIYPHDYTGLPSSDVESS